MGGQVGLVGGWYVNDELDIRLGGGVIQSTIVAAVAEVFAAAAINSPGMISSGDFCDPVTTLSIVTDSYLCLVGGGRAGGDIFRAIDLLFAAIDTNDDDQRYESLAVILLASSDGILVLGRACRGWWQVQFLAVRLAYQFLNQVPRVDMPRVFLSVSRWCHIGNLRLIDGELKMRTNVGMVGRYGR